jgi:hypothetical protein
MGKFNVRRQSRFLRRAVVLLLSVVLVAACSAAGLPAGSEEDAAEERSATRDFTVHPGLADDGFAGALTDVTALECEPGEGDLWQAQGLVTNPTDADADYRIYVAFVDDANDTSGIVQADVTGVASGDGQEWEAELALPGEDDLRCVLRVERVGEHNEDAEGAEAAESGESD